MLFTFHLKCQAVSAAVTDSNINFPCVPSSLSILRCKWSMSCVKRQEKNMVYLMLLTPLATAVINISNFKQDNPYGWTLGILLLIHMDWVEEKMRTYLERHRFRLEDWRDFFRNVIRFLWNVGLWRFDESIIVCSWFLYLFLYIFVTSNAEWLRIL